VPFDVNTQEVDVAGESSFTVGDHVQVKPAPASCMKRWALGQITGITSKHTVCVNGVPQHVRDVRTRRYGGAESAVGVNPRFCVMIQLVWTISVQDHHWPRSQRTL